MSRPPLKAFIAAGDRPLWPTMTRKPANQGCSKYVAKAVGASAVIACLALLVACQGVSAGPSQQQPGTLSLQTSVSFGSVAAGSNKTVTLFVANTGSAAVNVTAASFSTSYFSLTSPSLPLTIGAGLNTPLNLEFSPNAAGTFNATLTLTSNASNSSVAVSLSGTGTSTASGTLALNPTSENFGNVTVGAEQSDTVTLTNTGGASVDITQASITGTGFQLSGITPPLTLSSQQSTTFTVKFAPQAAGSANGTVTITSNASNPSLTMPLSGTGVTPGTLGANPTSLSFGNVQVGSNKTLSEKVTNNGGTSVTISQVAVSGTGFSFSGITTPVTLTAGQSATLSVTFTPTAAGSASGDLTISSNGSNPTLTIPLSGTGTVSTTGQLSVSPTTLAIGNVVVGTSGTGSGTLSATGASVTVSGASTNNSVFSVSGLSLPVTIPAGQSAPFTVTFTPSTTGAASATLTFTSNASPATTTETLTGTGTPAPVHSVNLSWTASTSTDISGYNIYRASYTTSCGSFSKINPALNTTTLYTDNNVTDGDAYCYAATAVDTSNAESGYSNIVPDVKIPPP